MDEVIKKEYVKLSQNGKNVTIIELCRSLNISRSTFYQYFSSKEEVENFILEDIATQLQSIFELREKYYDNNYIRFCMDIHDVIEGKEGLLSDERVMKKLEDTIRPFLFSVLFDNLRMEWKNKENVELIEKCFFYGLDFWIKNKSHSLDKIYKTMFDRLRKN